jgi:hypothetical protein
MAFYVDQVERLTLPLVRSLLRPKVFRSTTSFPVERFGFAVEVQLVRVPCPTSFGGHRVFLRCPRCAGLVNVLGVAAWVGWGCSKCLRWRGRNKRRIEVAPVINGGDAHA